MSDRINLVTRDSLPVIRTYISDADGPTNLSTCTGVLIKIAAAGSFELLKTITADVVDAQAGLIQFDFEGGVLDGLVGLYKWEIELQFPQGKQTVYKQPLFFVRPKIA